MNRMKELLRNSGAEGSLRFIAIIAIIIVQPPSLSVDAKIYKTGFVKGYICLYWFKQCSMP